MRILLIAVGCLLFGAQEASASHLVGVDLTYDCLGNNQYEITLTLYRDCSGITMPQTEFIDLASANCNLSGGPLSNIQVPLDTSYEVSQLCANVIGQSSCNTTPGTYPGVEVYIYRTIVTFPQACTDWIVSWSSCCRNPTITTLANPGSQGMYVEALVNSTICNDSPIFTSNPAPYFCAGQCYQYSHGAFDPENDQLTYELTCPLVNPGTCVNYNPGFSVVNPITTNPVNSFGFNTNTGEMSFCTAVGQAQTGAAAVTVYQIDTTGGTSDTLGYVQRDIQMIVLNDANCTSPVDPNSPLVSTGGSFDTTANTFVVCAGETLIFSIVLSDPDGDTIAIESGNTNLDQVFGTGNWNIIFDPSPGFRPDSVRIFVQINAVPSNIGVNAFTIGVTDNACPVPGEQILTYNLIIPGVEVLASDTTICPGIQQDLQMTANSFSSVGALAAGTFEWVQSSGTPITFSDTSIQNPIVTVPANTLPGDSIVLSVTFTTVPDPSTGTSCVTTDDVIIYLQDLPLSLDLLATETSLCPNNQDDTISFTSNIAGPGIDLVNGTYTWTATPSSYLGNLTSTAVSNPDAIVAGGPNDSVTYTISYAYGLCVGSDSVTLKWRPGIPDVNATLDTICPGDTTVLTAALTDSIVVLDPSACSTYTATSIPFAPIAGTGTTITVNDESFSNALPIGFDFDFYCNTYSQFLAGDNGFITFDLGGPSTGCCSGDAIPSANDPNNLIALFWEDLDDATIEYFTVGTAPNRILVVNYLNVPHWPAGVPVTGQILLYETTNVIELHVTSQPDATGIHTQGIENADGTIGVASPGRNSSNWTATNDAYRFTPSQSVLYGPFTYDWTPGFATTNPTVFNPQAFPQATTTFHVQINEQGCILQDSIEIFVNSQVPAPVITCGTPANQATSVLFEWGQAPGATGWEYSLDSGNTWIPVPLADSSLLITGLTNGDCANILVRGLGGSGACPTNAATYLECCTTPCPPPNTSTVTDLSCNGSANGAIQIAVSGGVLGDHPNFTGTLFDSSGAQVGSPVSDAATLNFTNLNAGVYYTYIQDTLGCFTYSDTVVITEPDVLVLNLDSTTLTTCFSSTDGTASVLANGGTTAYTWQWDAAANSQTTATAVGLGAGTYQVVVTDANNCMDTLDVTVYSPFPAAPSLTLNTTDNTTCGGNGTATVFSTFNLVGNANNFTYTWSNGDTGPMASSLIAGPVTVTVTDENGCEATATANISGSASVSVTSMQTINPGCNQNDGQITAVATGDSTGYTYQWSANALGQNTALVTGLGIGNYFVTVTGLSNGCTAVANITLQNNSALNIVGFNVANPSCGANDGTATVLTIGSGNVAGPITYAWSNGQTSGTATGLQASTVYTVTVTDQATGCASVGDTIFPATALAASFTTVNNPSCNLDNGSITVGVTGAPGPFTYAWSNSQTGATATALAAGTYTCTVTYQGCNTVVGPQTLTNDQLQIAITDKDDLICNGDLSSYANLTVTPASATPSFAWSNGATTQNISGMAAGTYTVTATLGGCAVTQSITVQNIVLTLNATAGTTPPATIQVNGQIAIDGNVNTNHANPTYLWTMDSLGVVTLDDSSMVSTMATGVEGGDVWLTITANAGPCSAVDSVMVTVESYMGMPTAFTPNADGINDFFRPAGLENSDKVLRFEIYNRWGQLLYSEVNPHEWDGTFNGVAQPQDVYIYIFEYAPENEEPIMIRGEFTLIR